MFSLRALQSFEFWNTKFVSTKNYYDACFSFSIVTCILTVKCVLTEYMYILHPIQQWHFALTGTLIIDGLFMTA